MPGYLPDDYKEVGERIKEFREDHPDGKIETYLLGMYDGAIGFSANVQCEDGLATGHGFGSKEAVGEKVGEKWREYAETVAIGRALKHLGYEQTGSLRQSNTKHNKSQSKPPDSSSETPEASIEAVKGEIEAKKGEWKSWDDPATDKQAQAFSSFWEDSVGTGRDDKIEFLELVTGRDLESSKDLYKAEISPLLEQAFNNSEQFIELCKNYEIPF